MSSRRVEAAGIALAYGAVAFLAAYLAFHEALLGAPVFSSLELVSIAVGGGLALVFAVGAAIVTLSHLPVGSGLPPIGNEVKE